MCSFYSLVSAHCVAAASGPEVGNAYETMTVWSPLSSDRKKIRTRRRRCVPSLKPCPLTILEFPKMNSRR